MEGAKTMDGLKEFTPLMILRYSATHRQGTPRFTALMPWTPTTKSW